MKDEIAKNQEDYIRLRDYAFQCLREHEGKAHNGTPCITERINMMAWLCHALGVDSEENLYGVFHRILEYRDFHDSTNPKEHQLHDQNPTT